MKADIKNLLSQVKALVDEENPKGRRQKRYPQELKSLVHLLVNKHNVPPHVIASLTSLSLYTARRWASSPDPLLKKRRSKNIEFKKISLASQVQGGQSEKKKNELSWITASLTLLTVAQALALARVLFLS